MADSCPRHPARLALLIALLSAAPASRGQDAPDVAEALASSRLPWYDAPADAARPLWPVREESSSSAPTQIQPSATASSGRDIGSGVATVLLVTLLIVLVGALIWNLRGLAPPKVARRAPVRRAGGASRVGPAVLPEGLAVGSTDPLEVARRLRASGDLAGAVAALFAHLLIRLDELGLSPITRGQTARQLVRAVPDRDLRREIEPTLRLFEASYYGARPPDPEAFEAAWAAAERVDRRLSGQGGPR